MWRKIIFIHTTVHTLRNTDCNDKDSLNTRSFDTQVLKKIDLNPNCEQKCFNLLPTDMEIGKMFFVFFLIQMSRILVNEVKFSP